MLWLTAVVWSSRRRRPCILRLRSLPKWTCADAFLMSSLTSYKKIEFTLFYRRLKTFLGWILEFETVVQRQIASPSDHRSTPFTLVSFCPSLGRLLRYHGPSLLYRTSAHGSASGKAKRITDANSLQRIFRESFCRHTSECNCQYLAYGLSRGLFRIWGSVW